MGIKGNNFWHSVKSGLALAPQSIALSTSAQGKAIVEPWRFGRQITFGILGGEFGAAGSITVDIQGRLRSDGATWETLKQKDGTTDLEVDPSVLDFATQIDEAVNGYVSATVDFGDVDSTTYEALRILVTEDGGSNAVLVGADYHISDLMEHMSGDTDYLFDRAHAQP